jgi:hypothetical protein
MDVLALPEHVGPEEQRGAIAQRGITHRASVGNRGQSRRQSNRHQGQPTEVIRRLHGWLPLMESAWLVTICG